MSVSWDGDNSTVAHEPGSRDRYTLTGLHAQGGIGQVWLALDGDLGRQVALKELRPERAGNAALASRFLEEARITGQLEHPGIVPVYELGRPPMTASRSTPCGSSAAAPSPRRPAITTAAARPARPGPLDLIALLNTFVAVCNAVAYAHSRRVIHRALSGQFSEAEAALAETRTIFAKAPPFIPHLTAWAECWYGASLAGQRRYAEAEPRLLSAEKGLREAPTTPRRHYREALEQLIKLYEAWGKPNEAARWTKELAGNR